MDGKSTVGIERADWDESTVVEERAAACLASAIHLSMQPDVILGFTGIILAYVVVGLGVLHFVARHWDLSFRMATVAVVLGLGIIAQGILKDWVQMWTDPDIRQVWQKANFGAPQIFGGETEQDEDIRLCGADYSRCMNQ